MNLAGEGDTKLPFLVFLVPRDADSTFHGGKSRGSVHVDVRTRRFKPGSRRPPDIGAARDSASPGTSKTGGFVRSLADPRKVDVDQFDPRFALGDLGPSKETEIRFVPTYHVPEGIGDFETWVIYNLAKDARTIFEFGTGTGKTTYFLAPNSPPEARITTLMLPHGRTGPRLLLLRG